MFFAASCLRIRIFAFSRIAKLARISASDFSPPPPPLLAKWLATNPDLLIVDEPTRGIDVGTKAEVHRMLSQNAQNGMAIVMVSSELPEVLGMSDRILVMREGRMVAEFSRKEATAEKIISVATGAKK